MFRVAERLRVHHLAGVRVRLLQRVGRLHLHRQTGGYERSLTSGVIHTKAMAKSSALVLGLFALGLLVAPRAAARPVEGEAAHRADVVMANGNTPAAFLDALEQAALAQLADVRLRLSRSAPVPSATADLRARMASVRGTSALAVFWVDDDLAAQQTLLYLYDPRGERMLVRTFPPAGEATAEGISLVVRSSALALAEGGAIGVEVPRVETKPAPPAPPRPPAAPPVAAATHPAQSDAALASDDHGARSRLAIGVAYAGVASPSLGFWRSGAEIALRARVTGATFAGVGLRVLSRVEIRDPAVALSITSYPIEIFLGHAFAWGRFTLAPQVGFVGEISERSATAFESRLVATSDRSVLVLGAAPRLEASYALTRWLSVRLAGGADVLINPPEYVVDLPAPRLVAGADHVRPRAEVGLLVRAW